MIRVGIGGWTYPPWRGVFYPPGLPHSHELPYASRQVTAIEINGTFYRTQSAAEFRRWAAETPDDFVFTLKGPRYVVNRRILAESGPGLSRFVESGIAELGAKLGPILWQLPPTKPFEEGDLTAFLAMLPARADGLELQHALEVRHPSFLDGRFVRLAQSFAVPIVYADSLVYPAIADLTGPFVYARLQRATEEEAQGYPPEELDLWAERAAIWSQGGAPQDLPSVLGCGSAAPAVTDGQTARPVFLFVINKGKVRAPAAAQAIIARLGGRARTSGVPV